METTLTKNDFFNTPKYAGCKINGKAHPIKNVKHSFSKFSNAKYLKKLPQDFKIKIEKGVHGEICYYEWENTMMIPEYNESNYLIY